MDDYDRNPGWERGLRAQRDGGFDERATPRQALWSWLAAAAIVLVLGTAFYGIDAQRAASHRAPAVTAQPAAHLPTTTGQGGTRE
jgi:hypothetical protein